MAKKPKVSSTYQAVLSNSFFWLRSPVTDEDEISGLARYEREFLRDSLVRNCVTANAFYPFAKGFETVLELPEPGDLSKEQIEKELKQHRYVKDEIDALNKAVNLDRVLFIAQVKRCIYGRAGFEIVLDNKGVPTSLLPLDSSQLEPLTDEETHTRLVGFKYKGTESPAPEEILYFTNLCLETTFQGLSDIEPVLDTLTTRRSILKTDLKETAEKLWAPMVILTVDVTGLSDKDAEKAIQEIISGIEPGKNIVLSQKVTATPVELKVDIPGLIQTLEYCDLEIVGNFKVPRFLIGREKQVNRATSYAELEAYRDGVITNIQRYFKRELERQWYDRQVRRILGLKPKDSLPVHVKHRWNSISTTDFYEMAKALGTLWGTHGTGALGGYREKVWKLLGWDPTELEET